MLARLIPRLVALLFAGLLAGLLARLTAVGARIAGGLGLPVGLAGLIGPLALLVAGFVARLRRRRFLLIRRRCLRRAGPRVVRLIGRGRLAVRRRVVRRVTARVGRRGLGRLVRRRRLQRRREVLERFGQGVPVGLRHRGRGPVDLPSHALGFEQVVAGQGVGEALGQFGCRGALGRLVDRGPVGQFALDPGRQFGLAFEFLGGGLERGGGTRGRVRLGVALEQFLLEGFQFVAGARPRLGLGHGRGIHPLGVGLGGGDLLGRVADERRRIRAAGPAVQFDPRHEQPGEHARGRRAERPVPALGPCGRDGLGGVGGCGRGLAPGAREGDEFRVAVGVGDFQGGAEGAVGAVGSVDLARGSCERPPAGPRRRRRRDERDRRGGRRDAPPPRRAQPQA